MIAAATQQISSGKMWFNWFDVILVLVVLFGIWRGRKNGMSKEFLPVTRMLTTVIGAGLGYQLLGDFFIQQGVIKSIFGKNIAEKTAAYVSAYLIIGGTVWLIFQFIKSRLKSRLEGSNAFGSGEYYLGITSGVVRCLCWTIFVLALLHAPFYSKSDIAAQRAYNNRWYGGGVKDFKGDFIPSLDEVQVAVFVDSRLGPYIRSGISALLINTTPGPKQSSVIFE